MTSKQSKTILNDAINDLSIVDRMIERKQIKHAQEELVSIFTYATQVKGGDNEVGSLMDKFQNEFSKRYAVAYAR